MQSDWSSFILDSYLYIGASICDVSTWANITRSLIESQRPSRKNPRSSTKRWSRGSDTVCRSSQHVLLSLSLGCLPLCHHIHPARSYRKQHPAKARFTSWEAHSALMCPQHATVSTVVLFKGHFSWLLKSLTFSSLPFIRGHWHPLYESRVNCHSWTSCIFFHPPFLFSFSFTTFVLLQYGGAVFSEMDQRREDGAVGGWRGGGWKEGQVAGRLCSVAGLVKLIDEKGRLVFLAGWGFILLAALIHLSKFKVAVVVVAGGVAITLQGC